MKTIGLARLGRDAEIRTIPSGEKVCNLSLAVNWGRKGEDGNRPTQWIDASLWGAQAEALAPYLKKGTVHCFTLSELHIETFQGQNGEGHKLAGRVDSVELGPRQGDAPQGNTAPASRATHAPARPPAAAPRAAPAPAPRASGGFTDMDDDIPF